MALPYSLRKMVVFGLLAVSVSVSTVCSVALAQVGPPSPREKEMRPNGVSNAVMKFLSKNNKKQDEKVAEAGDTAAPADPKDAKNDSEKADKKKPAVKAPAATSREDAEAGPLRRPPMLTQPPLTNAKIETPQMDNQNPPVINHPRLDDPANPLGLTDAENRLKKYIVLLDAKRYNEAKPGLTQLRQWLVDLTEAHIGLYKTLNQLPSARAQAELEKELALQFAQLRDRSMLEMAKVYVFEKDYPKAVKELTEIVKSQPKSKIGLRSYELLQEIGFTEKLQIAE